MNLNGVFVIHNMFQNGGYYTALSFNDITLGSNGDYAASKGWDAVTGNLGSFSALGITTTKLSNGGFSIHFYF